MDTILLGHCIVDLPSTRVVWPDRSHSLTPVELGVLRRLAERPGRVVARSELESSVWPSGPSTSRAIDHAVRRLRAKIELDPERPRSLTTVRGLGFRLQMLPSQAPAEASPSKRIDLGDRVIDLERGFVETVRGPVRLTRTETALLGYLVQRSGRTVSRTELLQDVWGYAAGSTSQTVTSTLHRLRRKIEADPSRPVHLLTRPGSGVQFRPMPRQSRRRAARLVGRADLLVELNAACASTAIVTLTGPGGIGKTAIAQRFVEADPTSWVWLDAARYADPDALKGIVLPLLAEGRSVVLDEAERHVDAINHWLDALPPLDEGRLLVTSQIALKRIDETSLVVPPLGPDDARTLFGRRWDGRERMDPGALDDLLRLLDGIPLAIELAAAQARDLGVQALADRLDRQEDLLDFEQGGSSLRGRLARSWQLLGPSERSALVALLLFPEEFGLDAAEAVIGERPTHALLVLVRHGWLRVRRERGSRQFRLPTPMRWFVASTGAPSALHRRRFFLHFANLATSLYRAYERGPDPADAVRRMDVHSASFLAAHAIGLREAPERAAKLIADLREHLSRFPERHEGLIRRSLVAGAGAQRGRLRVQRAGIRQARDDFEAADADLEAGRRLALQIDDLDTVIVALRLEAQRHRRRGDFAQS
ncbi:MAG: winged helix-turn-helix domain-containing protein, partial [Myxococcota bacterium]